MAPVRRGLGPQGHAAIERASQENLRAPIIGRQNPAALSAPEPGEDEPTDWYTFDSSRVSEAAYDAAAERLYVRFVKPDGSVVYVYDGVQANEWRNLRRSQSPGKYVNRVLNSKDYHRYRGIG
jgi:hypothetical protein